MEYKKPMWQLVILYLVIGSVVYAGIYYFYFAKKGGYTYQSNSSAPSAATLSLSTTSPEAKMVTFDDNGYTPSTFNIAAGDTVTWTNKGSKSGTVNSDPHPDHTDYPPLNLGTIQVGSTVSLKFDTVGTYKYHNHLDSSQYGAIIVK